MKSTKVEVGQCYRWRDHVYEVIGPADRPNDWVVRDTLSKNESVVSEKFLVQQERPFQNYG